MACPFLVKTSTAICKARNCLFKIEVEVQLYEPSAFQLEEYCKGPGHRKCPFYLISQQ